MANGSECGVRVNGKWRECRSGQPRRSAEQLAGLDDGQDEQVYTIYAAMKVGDNESLGLAGVREEKPGVRAHEYRRAAVVEVPAKWSIGLDGKPELVPAVTPVLHDPELEHGDGHDGNGRI